MTTLFDAEAKKQYQAIKTRKLRFVTFILNKEKASEIVVEKVGDKKCTWNQFKECLNDITCRFALYDYEFKTKDNRATSKLYCIFWNPKNASQLNRILYSQALQSFRDQLTGVENQSTGLISDIKALLSEEVTEGDGTGGNVQTFNRDDVDVKKAEQQANDAKTDVPIGRPKAFSIPKKFSLPTKAPTPAPAAVPEGAAAPAAADGAAAPASSN